MSVTLAPPPFLFFMNPNNSGAPAAGFKLFTYQAGTSTKQATWTDSTQVTQNPNPIILDSNGAAAIWGDPTLSYKFILSPANDTDPPTSPLRTTDNLQFPITFGAGVALQFYARTAAEIAAGITPTNFSWDPGDARRYGAKIDGATDDTVAYNSSLLQAYQAGGADPFWPAGTAVVSQLTIPNPVRIRTDGYATTIQQKLVAGLTNTPIILVQASNVYIDPITFVGNIATDASEFNHCLQVGGTAINTHITILGVRASNIRGDIVYLGGTTTFPLTDVKIGQIDGTNILRNEVSAVGVNGCEIDSIIGTQIGYRNFDIEPNAGSQPASNIRCKYLQGSNIQTAGSAATANIGTLVFDFLYLDNNLSSNSNPGYFKNPTQAGNIGIIGSNVANMQIGFLYARNFQERLLNFSVNTITTLISVGCVDISNCNTTEATFLTLFNVDSFTTLELGSGTVVLAGLTRYIAKGGGTYRFRKLAISGGCVAATSSHCEFDDLAINANLVSGNLFASINSSLFKNVVVTNDSAATMMILCSNNTFIDYSGSPSAFNTTGGTHLLIKSSLAGNTYHNNSLETAVAFNPGAINSGATAQTTVTVNGAVIGDLALASFVDIPTGYATVTWQANVTSSNTVTVTARNNGGSTVTFGNNTLRATVIKAQT